MRASKRILTAAVVLGVAAGVGIVVIKARSIKEVATHVADDIETELNELDPVTRAAVLGKLTSDAAQEVKAHRS